MALPMLASRYHLAATGPRRADAVAGPLLATGALARR